jgi:CAAX prenyl protease-like protein
VTGGEAGRETAAARRPGEPEVWPYVVPLAGFLALTTLEAYLPAASGGLPSPVWYPLGYAVKIAAVCGLIWVSRSTLADLLPRPSPVGAALAVGLGLLVTATWVGLDGRYPELTFLGRRTAFDPTVMPRPARAAFLAVRVFGLVAVVPLIEELFYRSFLMRWITDPDYTRVPIGRVTPLSMAVTTGVFALSHPEWLPAALTGLAWGWLVARTRSVSACVLSHATANLALGVYVLATGAWKYW